MPCVQGGGECRQGRRAQGGAGGKAAGGGGGDLNSKRGAKGLKGHRISATRQVGTRLAGKPVPSVRCVLILSGRKEEQRVGFATVKTQRHGRQKVGKGLATPKRGAQNEVGKPGTIRCS
jgi:hypothetical protein